MNEEQNERPALAAVPDPEQGDLQAEAEESAELESQIVPNNMLEIPLVNAGFEVVDFSPDGVEGGKAILIETEIGLLIGGGMMTPPKPVRFVIPLLAEAAQNLGSQLTGAGVIQVATSMKDLPPPPAAV